MDSDEDFEDPVQQGKSSFLFLRKVWFGRFFIQSFFHFGPEIVQYKYVQAICVCQMVSDFIL